MSIKQKKSYILGQKTDFVENGMRYTEENQSTVSSTQPLHENSNQGGTFPTNDFHPEVEI
jgi:hypothetical protein